MLRRDMYDMPLAVITYTVLIPHNRMIERMEHLALSVETTYQAFGLLSLGTLEGTAKAGNFAASC